MFTGSTSEGRILLCSSNHRVDLPRAFPSSANVERSDNNGATLSLVWQPQCILPGPETSTAAQAVTILTGAWPTARHYARLFSIVRRVLVMELC